MNYIYLLVENRTVPGFWLFLLGILKYCTKLNCVKCYKVKSIYPINVKISYNGVAELLQLVITSKCESG